MSLCGSLRPGSHDRFHAGKEPVSELVVLRRIEISRGLNQKNLENLLRAAVTTAGSQPLPAVREPEPP